MIFSWYRTKKLSKVKRRLKLVMSNRKTLIIVSTLLFFIYILIYPYLYYEASYQAVQFLNHLNIFRDHAVKRIDMKYLLVWTFSVMEPIVYLGNGQESFIKANCSFRNCFVTDDRTYFRDIQDFDIVLFHGPEIHRTYWYLPPKRSPSQIFLYASKESSHYYPVCQNQYNGFFNRTWTYRLDSDVPFNYIMIKNEWGEPTGPSQIMHWMDAKEMRPIGENIKIKLIGKRKAAAWFVSNCNSLSNREDFVTELKDEMKRYELQLDIYGACGDKKCPRNKGNECDDMIERDYFFYLAFENSFSEDYVTEKLLKGLLHYAVPIVYGAANYSRFVPPGAYLDARALGVQELAKQMRAIIDDKERYYNFFRWRNHYTYMGDWDATNASICALCASLHDLNFTRENVYSDFLNWWTAPRKCPN